LRPAITIILFSIRYSSYSLTY